MATLLVRVLVSLLVPQVEGTRLVARLRLVRVPVAVSLTVVSPMPVRVCVLPPAVFRCLKKQLMLPVSAKISYPQLPTPVTVPLSGVQLVVGMTPTVGVLTIPVFRVLSPPARVSVRVCVWAMTMAPLKRGPPLNYRSRLCRCIILFMRKTVGGPTLAVPMLVVVPLRAATRACRLGRAF